METDEALLDRVQRSGGAFLRLYRWDPATLSIGRNQRMDAEPFPVVRRPTGGKAVWHEHEVTYAVAAPIALFGSLRNAYCEIHARLAQALRSMGVDAVLASARRPIGPSATPPSCFALPVGGEILVDGRKLVGSAQVRRGDAFLQHGSILLAEGSRSSWFAGATTLATVLRRPVSFEEVADAVQIAWEIASPAAR